MGAGVGEAVSANTGTTPVPVSLTVLVGVFALVVKVSVPVDVAAVVGAKVTVTVQDAPTARDAPQLFAIEKPLLICTDAMVRGLVVSLLVSVTVCEKVLPMPTGPKLMKLGVYSGDLMLVMTTVTSFELTVLKFVPP